MDLVIFLILLGVVVFFFRKFSSFIYSIAIIDILLRIVTYVKLEVTKGEVFAFLDKYIPDNIPIILAKYADGLLLNVLMWSYVAVFVIFEFYVIRTFIRKK